MPTADIGPGSPNSLRAVGPTANIAIGFDPNYRFSPGVPPQHPLSHLPGPGGHRSIRLLYRLHPGHRTEPGSSGPAAHFRGRWASACERVCSAARHTVPQLGDIRHLSWRSPDGRWAAACCPPRTFLSQAPHAGLRWPDRGGTTQQRLIANTPYRVAQGLFCRVDDRRQLVLPAHCLNKNVTLRK